MCPKPNSEFGKAQKMNNTFYGGPKRTWLGLLQWLVTLHQISLITCEDSEDR